MLRKTIISLLCLLPLCLSAQLATGSWKVYTAFGKPDKLIEAPHLVYLLTQGSLHSYDKDNDESRSYLTGEDLSGHYIKDMFYNEARRYLMVCYENSGIDLLYDDGRRVSLPDIRDANLNTSKVINDVAFDGDLIYVATSFGLVVFSESSTDVKESGIYDVNLADVEIVGDHIMIMPTEGDKNHHLLTISKTDRLHRIENFKDFCTVPSEITGLLHLSLTADDGWVYYIGKAPWEYFYKIAINFNTNQIDIRDTWYKLTNVFSGDGCVYFTDRNAIWKMSLPWEISKVMDLPEIFNENILTTRIGFSSLWAANTTGLAHYKLEADGKITVLRDRYRPTDATSLSDISCIFSSSDGRGFYISNLGLGGTKPIGNGDFPNTIFAGNFIENGRIENIDVNGPLTTRNSPSANHSLGDHIYAPTFVVEDPDDHSIRYIGSGLDGIYVIKDGKEIGKFDENSKMYKVSNWAWRPNIARIDKDGNLLVGVYTHNKNKPTLIVLPADKRRKDPRTVTADDWVALDVGDFIYMRDIDLLLCEKSPMIFMLSGHQAGGGFVALHHGGTVADPSDDKHVIVSNMIDQDGKSFSPQWMKCFVEDKRGRIWCGTTSGLFEITNPLGVFSSDFTINRLKVPRNDGTNLADYLLESEDITCMAVDASNRKWIGTNDSGVYLVSENGDEIISNFNVSNSPLSTNTITAVYADPNSNSVFFATLEGLFEYSSGTSPARPDYSDVYAYPNPVEPGYTGWITIKGLMDSSLVKIMDSGMHLVYQTTSQGGMALWDGCTLNGARVKSGVYYVLASTSDDTSTEGDVVAKILVVN